MERSGLEVAPTGTRVVESGVALADAHLAAFVAALATGRRVALIGASDSAAEAIAERAQDVRRVEVDRASAFLADAEGDADLIVVRDIDALGDHAAVFARLRDQASQSVGVVAIAPNALLRASHGTPPPTAIGLERIAAELPHDEGWTLLFHHMAQGSLILGAGDEAAEAALVNPLHAEPDYAAAFVAVANLDVSEAAVSGHAAFVLEPRFDRYLRAMESAREQLAEANAQLGREHMGIADSAAASALDKISARATRTEQELEIARHQIIELEAECLRRHDLMLAERERADNVSVVLSAPRYRLADGVQRRVLRLPGARALARLAGGRMRRA